tara:strand:+ start:449 stop:1168 length:720 start_codon:yes stop_codon:yes gene_type:complete
MSEYNKTLIKRYKDRLKETKKKRDKGEKPKKNEVSFAQQIKGLNDKIKELEAKNKKVGTALRKEKRSKTKSTNKKTTDTGVGSLSGVSAARLKAKQRTDLQKGGGDSRTNRKKELPPISSANLGPQPKPKTVKEIPEPKALKSTAKPGPAELASEKPKAKTKDTTIDKSAGSKKEEGIGTKIARALGDKRSEEEMIRTRKMNEEDEKEMGMNKGGAVKKKYGMREGGFTKRGGMYKKGY